MSNIIISGTAIENLAEALGVDFNKQHNSGYMGPDNERGLFVECVADNAGCITNFLDDNAELYIVDEDKFVEAFVGTLLTYREFEREVEDAQ